MVPRFPRSIALSHDLLLLRHRPHSGLCRQPPLPALSWTQTPAPSHFSTAASPAESPAPAQDAAPRPRRPVSFRQAMWEQRHAWGNMAMLFSCGLLAVKVATQRRETDEARAELEAAQHDAALELAAASAELASASAELDSLREDIRRHVQQGSRNLAARVSSVVEDSLARRPPRPPPAPDSVADADADALGSGFSEPEVTPGPAMHKDEGRAGSPKPPGKFMI